MSRSALVLAVHGSREGPSTGSAPPPLRGQRNTPRPPRGTAAAELAREYSDRLRETGLFDEVTAAFHCGEPAFRAVLDDLIAEEITVVPLMSSEGYFSEIVLPRELAKNGRYADVRVHQTRPVGTHPGIIPLVAGRVCHRMLEYNLEPGCTTLAIVGHGTRRHVCSRVATIALADAIRSLDLCHEVLPAFLDEDPGVEAILDRATQADIVVVPFLIGGGAHATQDIPEAVGLTGRGHGPAGPSHWDDRARTSTVRNGHGSVPTYVGMPSIAGRAGDRFIVCDAPLGTDPAMVNIILELARRRVGALPENRSRSAARCRRRRVAVPQEMSG